MIKNIIKFIVALVLAFVPVVVGFVFAGADWTATWMRILSKMSMSPASWVIATAGVVMYLASAGALFLVMREKLPARDKIPQYFYFAFSLALNTAWIYLFFVIQKQIPALMVLAASILIAVWMAGSFKIINKNSQWFVYLYALGLAFSTYLVGLTIFVKYKLGGLIDTISFIL